MTTSLPVGDGDETLSLKEDAERFPRIGTKSQSEARKKIKLNLDQTNEFYKTR